MCLDTWWNKVPSLLTACANASIRPFSSVLWSTANALLCMLLCVMHEAGCVFVLCVCLDVCLCVSGCEPSILLTPSGLCVGLFHHHYHLLVFYSGPQGYNDCRTFQICSSGPSDRLPYLKSGSHFLSQDRCELDSLLQFSWVKMVCSWTGVNQAEFDEWLMRRIILFSALHCWITLKRFANCGFRGKRDV